MVGRGSGMGTPHSAGYPNFGTGQVSRNTRRLGFDAYAKQQSNTFRWSQHTLEARNEGVYVQMSLGRSSIDTTQSRRWEDRIAAVVNPQTFWCFVEGGTWFTVVDRCFQTWPETEQIAPAVGRGAPPHSDPIVQTLRFSFLDPGEGVSRRAVCRRQDPHLLRLPVVFEHVLDFGDEGLEAQTLELPP